MVFLPAEIIKKKRDGLRLNREEIDQVISSFASGSLPDYQMAAWLMAVYFSGLDEAESSHLTRSMINSGERIDFSELGHLACDKHSTGGVGDKLSLILGPIAASCGVHVPMIAGRGLGHTGGTLDKLESIPGFNIHLKLQDFRKIILDHRLAIIGQTEEICPADKKIYALRDVTATVESKGLIGGSIMSKKIASGIKGLALDVKVGSGAFMKTIEQAEELARFLVGIGKEHDVTVAAYLTSMDQPLGRFVGNALEIQETMDILQGKSFVVEGEDLYQDSREISIELAGLMIHLAKIRPSLEASVSMARESLESGKALLEWEKMVERQGGDLSSRASAPFQYEVKVKEAGYFAQIDCEKVGIASILLGGGRLKKTDSIVPSAGIEIHRKLGQHVEAGDTLFTLHGESADSFAEAEDLLLKSLTLSLQPREKRSLIIKRIQG